MNKSVTTYNIHQILTISSEVDLPELAVFRVSTPVADPSIRVRLGNVDDASALDGDPNARCTVYKESTGQHGFAIRLTLGSKAEIVASPFLRHSPHVLYTNAVEPVLRWAFVERGYALVHGACLATDGHAFLITARTDTGKTTTVLKTLDANPEYTFLSDDLTLLQEDGTVLSYAKPLTISRHTLSAVHTPLLTAKERFTLVFQSRLHSKSGRWFGLMLTQFRLPMATTNAMVQWMVPPPKYPIQRLVPHAGISQSAHLAGMVVIERGDSTNIDLSHQEAVEMLLANCEDSYGFPPYADIKEKLYKTSDQDLRVEERRIVTAAMEHCPSIVMRSETRNWFMQLPDYISRVLHPRAWLPTAPALEGGTD